MKTTTFLFLGTLLFSLNSFSSTNSLWNDVEEGTPYDTLVQRFSRGESRTSVSQSGDWLDNARIHLGTGVINSMYSVSHLNGGRTQISGSGFLLSLGIDLFSPRWMAEGAIVSFGTVSNDRVDVTLREFDMRLVYRTLSSGLLGFKMFGGLAARNLRINYIGVGRDSVRDYTTPSSLIGLGSDINIAESVQLGLELSSRNSMIDDSPDQSTLDLTVRVNAQF